MQLHTIHAPIQFGVQILDVFGNYRADIGIDDGGFRALVFIHLRYHFARNGYRHVRHHFLGDPANTGFMHAIGIGIHQRYG